MSSINAIVDKFGEKLTLFSKNVTAEGKMKCDQVECTEITVSDQVSASDVVSSTATFSQLIVNEDITVGINASVLGELTVPTIKTSSDASRSDVSDVVLTSSFPLGFISSISGVTYASQISQKYDPDLGVYVPTLKIRVRSDCAVGLPANTVPAGLYITINNIPGEFHNSVLQYGTADFRNAGGLNGTGLGLYTVDTSVTGAITFGVVHNVHSEVTIGSAILNCDFEVRANTA